jgi:hypothetical protein
MCFHLLISHTLPLILNPLILNMSLPLHLEMGRRKGRVILCRAPKSVPSSSLLLSTISWCPHLVLLPNPATSCRHGESSQDLCVSRMRTSSPDVTSKRDFLRNSLKYVALAHWVAIRQRHRPLLHQIPPDPDQATVMKLGLGNPSTLKFGDNPQLAKHFLN